MRSGILVGALVALTAHRAATHARPVADSCFVAEVTMIVENVADYRFHRVVVAGIRKLNVVADASKGSCGAQNIGLREGMLRAIDDHIGASSMKAPRVRNNLELSNPSLDVVRGEIANIATRAREHAGEFSRVEVVTIAKDVSAGTEAISLPHLAKNDADALACTADNERLDRSGAKYRWAC